MQRKRSPIFPRPGLYRDPFYSKAIMEHLVESLNASPERPHEAAIKIELRRLVSLWKASGPDLYQLFEKNKQLESSVLHGSMALIPTDTGRAYLEWLPGPTGVDVARPKSVALRSFIQLIVNPEWESLAGPCRRCDRYYLNNTKRQKKYCSAKCGTYITASAAMRVRRARDREMKLRSAQEWIGKWAEQKRRLKWKPWVANESGSSLKFLTQAVAKGELHPPAGAD